MAINNFTVRSILLVALLFVPFTALRFGFLGVGEILIAVAFVLYIIQGKARIKLYQPARPVLFFWFSFLIVSILGMAVNGLLFGFQSGRPGTGFFDFFSYFFVFLTLLMFSDERLFPGNAGLIFFRKLFFVWGAIFSILLFLSFFYPTVLGFKLRYHRFFSPLVDNIHQAASITCAMTFVMFALVSQCEHFLKKLSAVLMGFLFSVMAIQSGSTKAFLGVVVGSVAVLLFLLTYRTSGRSKSYINLIVLFFSAVFFVFVMSIFFEDVAAFAVKFFNENDGGHARESLYSSGFKHGLSSFLVGYGPGSHAPYASGFSDAHNTVLTVFLQAGVIGVALLFWLLLRIFSYARESYFLVGALVSIAMYVIGGDILRRLPIWIILMGIVYISQSQSRPVASRRQIVTAEQSPTS